MELTAEINKVFGDEMAKLISERIGEEELNKCAESAWRQLNYVNNWPPNNRSDINRLVEKKILERVSKKVDEMLDSEKAQTCIDEEAKKLIEDIRARTKEKITESVSSRIAEMTVGYKGYGIRNIICDTINEAISR